MTHGNLDKFSQNDPEDINTLENAKKVIQTAINKVNLDLSGLTVLTEAATGHWIYTPFLAALANASSIICVTKDTKYGKPTKL